MIVWIMKLSEPTIYDHNLDGRRYMRYGLLAEYLVNENHKVVWWTDSFDHYKKYHRFNDEHTKKTFGNITIHWFKTPGYSKNMSHTRFRDHAILAKKVKRAINNEPKPDIILAGYPADTLCKVAVETGKKLGVPVVIDIRDLWPDAFFPRMTKILWPLLHIYTTRIRKRLRYSVNNADAIIGNTDWFIDWALKKTGRKRSELEAAFPIASKLLDLSKEELQNTEHEWLRKGVDFNNKKLRIAFLGSYSSANTFEEIYKAADDLKDYDIEFVMCGTGIYEPIIDNFIKSHPNMINAGWITAPMIRSLLNNSDIGLCPYSREMNFTQNLPNKPGELSGAGLPILSSIEGFLGEILRKYESGEVYNQNLTEVILGYYNDREKLARHSENSLKMYRELLDPDKIFPDMINHLKKVVSAYQQNNMK